MPIVQTKHYEYGQQELDYLQTVDEALGAAISRLGKLERVIIPDLFTALVYAIVGQLISVKAVQTIWGRMLERFGEISPQNLAIQSADDIQGCGMTMKKAVCIHQIAVTIAQGDFQLDDLYDLSDTEVIKKLMTLHGVGKWTAEMMLINSMERPDVVSWGDIAIRRGMMKLYGLSSLTKEQFDQYRLRYSPFGSVASIYLWEISFE
ncbi:DNA-3-methyladenine glycosylase family protein [Paenibacillus segetis]|uniref:DNA-3-methyladenine glycosylase II n=1 Tax=Paenibacillus segetis TaxID=1325360 RepID=A0ABQ1YGH4_9BACL|nr:DNA-3-methyladenine glycosylase 2 family protein [Paenibacillus segetis]GGH23685.1 3-methyladenine DNA glycosylase [Paenibacillus segetis]